MMLIQDTEQIELDSQGLSTCKLVFFPAELKRSQYFGKNVKKYSEI